MDTVNQEKFRRMAAYFAYKGREDDTLGVTKLNKLLYYADFTAYRELGNSISGKNYERWPEGPVPQNMHIERTEMVREGYIVTEKRPYHGLTQERVQARREPNMTLFTDQEVAILDRVYDRFASAGAIQISNQSHQELGWLLTNMREVIPYRTAWLSSRPLTNEEQQFGLEVARQHGLLA